MKEPEVERIVVADTGPPQRIDRYLAGLGRWGSRSQVRKWIEAGGVKVGGRPADPSQLLRNGDTVEIATPAVAWVPDVEPEPIELEVLFEDEWLLVINKPPGLVVHPAPGHVRGTLVAALLHHWGGMRPGLDPLRPGIVHRLDKDTSGVLLIAKDPETLAVLGRQFHDREVRKTYLAAVWGTPRDRRGVIDKPIGRDPRHRKKMSIRAGGRSAETSWEVIRTAREVSWLRLHPRTGRTHQIRVHLAALGHPIVADATYGRARSVGPVPVPPRQALHAERLAFRHPATGEAMSFRAALAQDLRPLWEYAEPFGPADPSTGHGVT